MRNEAMYKTWLHGGGYYRRRKDVCVKQNFASPMILQKTWHTNREGGFSKLKFDLEAWKYQQGGRMGKTTQIKLFPHWAMKSNKSDSDKFVQVQLPRNTNLKHIPSLCLSSRTSLEKQEECCEEENQYPVISLTDKAAVILRHTCYKMKKYIE